MIELRWITRLHLDPAEGTSTEKVLICRHKPIAELVPLNGRAQFGQWHVWRPIPPDLDDED